MKRSTQVAPVGSSRWGQSGFSVPRLDDPVRWTFALPSKAHGNISRPCVLPGLSLADITVEVPRLATASAEVCRMRNDVTARQYAENVGRRRKKTPEADFQRELNYYQCNFQSQIT
jgi:hypothetical protein